MPPLFLLTLFLILLTNYFHWHKPTFGQCACLRGRWVDQSINGFQTFFSGRLNNQWTPHYYCWCQYQNVKVKVTGTFLHIFVCLRQHFCSFYERKSGSFTKAKISYVTSHNLCYYGGQRLKSNGRFCELLHVFATVLYHFALLCTWSFNNQNIHHGAPHHQ